MTAIGLDEPDVEVAGTAIEVPADGAAIELRMLELRHRIKNILAIVQSLVNQTLRNDTSVEEARQLLGSRLVAIGHAVDLLLSTSWQSAPLDALIRSAMTIGSERIHVGGPRVEVGPSAAMMLSILFHELECNAIKYGALSDSNGVVHVSWAADGGDGEQKLDLVWEERDGPHVAGPVKEGFGSKLVSRIATRFGGSSEAEFTDRGLRWRFTAPLASLQA